jgi:hypothetical protein
MWVTRATAVTTAFAATILLADFAPAYCRTTTCNPSVSCSEDPKQCCKFDSHGCDTNGLPVAWRNGCVAYSVFDAPSEDRHLSQDELRLAVDRAFANWLGTDCAGTPPTINVENFGPSHCGAPTFNPDDQQGNANVWMFRDGTWPHANVDPSTGTIDASALALTTGTFDWRSGELLDADVELNTAQAAFTDGDEAVDIDLKAIVQHESGHFLGLDHSDVDEATMYADYDPGTISTRTLSQDDEQAICAAYPKDRVVQSDRCQAYGVYSTECAAAGGCSLAGSPDRSHSGSWAALAGLGLVAVAHRRTANPRTRAVRSTH